MFKQRVFNGERLKSARIYRGKTIAELADETEVSKQAISQFENGKANPSFETLLKLINNLAFPREYFYENDKNEIIVGNTYFRALLTTNKKDQLCQIEKIKMLAKIYHFLNKYIEFPKLNIPTLDFEVSDTESAALRVREYWGLGTEPISNLVYILEKNGFIVTSLSTESKGIDAFSQQQKLNGQHYYFIVLGKDKDSAARRQFDSAHELGHSLLHDGSVSLDEVSREEFRQIEKEANDFAAAFLLPRVSFIKDLIYPNNLDFYVELKKKWKVSISAMVIRTYQLKVINYNQYQYLMRQISKKGWRTREPLDNTLQVSEPTVLKKAVEILITNNVLNGEQILQQLSNDSLTVSPTEIEILLSLESGTLSKKEQKGTVISLKRK